MKAENYFPCYTFALDPLKRETLHFHRIKHCTFTKKQAENNVEEGTLCSGTIFHENWVMTAAHCCLYKFKVTMHFNDFHTGVDDLNELKVERYGSSFTIHEFYHPDVGNDICIIELPGDFHGSRAPCMLPENAEKTAVEQLEEHHGAQCWVGGWGHTFYAGQSSNTARSVGLNLFSREYCLKHSFYQDSNLFALNEDAFCAGIPHNKETATNSAGYHVTQKGADSCKGDSGGPLICDINDRITFVGIVSKGYRCNAEGWPGIYTNVQAFRPWLDESKYDFLYRLSCTALHTEKILFDDFSINENFRTGLYLVRMGRM